MAKEINIEHKGKAGAFNVREFDWNNTVSNPSIVLIAKRGSGKSVFVRDILQHFSRTIPMGIVISKTERVSPFFKEFVPDMYIYDEFDSGVIKKLLGHQEKNKEKAERRKKQGKETNVKSFIVMDDCLSDGGTWAKDPTIKELLFNGRHFDITYILTMQHPMGIKPDLRLNFDYIVLLADNNWNNQKKLYEQYAGIFPNFEAFRQAFNQLTEDYGAMIIVNRGASNDIFDKVFYYKAHNYDIDKSKKLVTVGGGQYRKFAEDNTNKGYAKSRYIDDNVDMTRKTLVNHKLIVNKIERSKRR